MPTVMVVKFTTSITPFEELVESLNPTIWYKFNETSGDIINHGSAGAGHNLSASLSPGTYNVNGHNKTGGAFEFDGGGRFLGAGPSPNDTSYGTIWCAQTISNRWMWDVYRGFDGDDLVLQSGGVGIRWFYSGPGFNDDAFINYPSQPAINDGNFHSIALRKNNDANAPDCIVDKGLLTPSIDESGGGDTTRWFDDYTESMSMGGRGSPDSAGVRSLSKMDEWLYFEGVELTDEQINSLHDSYFFGANDS